MEANARNQVIALAALFQCTELVRQIAWEGHVDAAAFETCIGSVFTLDADSIEAIYVSPDRLALGLATLQQQLGDKSPRRDMDVARYMVSLLHLEKRLHKRPDLVVTIQEGILTAEKQLEFFDKTHDNVIARLADVYQNTISLMGPRIIVQGDQGYLSNADNASRIRALLLAGIRAAVLWRQAGGSRWSLIFGRRKLLETAQKMLPIH